MRILLFGGTTEGRLLAGDLSKRGFDVTVSVATKLGEEELAGLDCRILAGRVTKDEMPDFVAGYDLVIDATHPYAKEVTKNITYACSKRKIPRRRILRAASDAEDCVKVPDHEAAVSYLKEKPGNILLAIGSKELQMYKALEAERLFARVLPTHQALDLCETAGIPHRNILAMQGPFTQEMNEAVIRQYRIRYLVTKDGGDAGGFRQKLDAAKACSAELVLVGRPEDEGMTMDELLKELEEMA